MSQTTRKSLSRRKFIKGVGLAAGALALSPIIGHSQANIKLGILTGTKVVFGEGTINGAQLAIDEINAAGGVLGRKLEMVIADLETESDPTKAVSGYQSLAGSTDALLGIFRSEMVQAILPQVPRSPKPFLITGSTSLGTDQVKANYDAFKTVFRSVIINTYSLVVDMARFMGDFVSQLNASNGVANKKVVLIGEDLTSGNLFLQLLGPHLGRLGFQVEGPVRLAVGTTDMGPIVERVRSFNAGLGVTFFSDPNLAILFPSAVAQARLPLPLFGVNAPLQSDGGVQAARGAATGYTIVDFSADAPVSPRTQKFFRDYKAKFNKTAVYTAGTTYDSIYVLAEAIKKAGKTDTNDVVAALEATSYVGAGGLVKFFDKSEPKKEDETITVQTKAGELEFQNTLNLGLIKLSLKQSHDTVYGFNDVPNNTPTAFDGVRPVYVQVRADGSRPVLYPAEFAGENKYQKPPYIP
jgi:branched-chain amino acid transport system substrate-binding protein